MVKGALLSLFAAMALCGLASTAEAQVQVNFSGGGGTPVTLTLTAPVVYTINTSAASGNAPLFVIQGVGDDFTSGFPATGSIQFSINGGAFQNLTTIGTGNSGINLTVNDVYLYGSSFPGVNAGDTVTLSAGSLTTTSNDSATPASGLYQTYITNVSTRTTISTNGVSPVPEPSTYGLIGMAAAALSVMVLRRRSLQS